MTRTRVVLELDDIQSGVLRPRPTPYAATYILLRIDDRDARAGADAARSARVVTSAADPTSPLADTWVSVALTYHGLEALGVPQDSLDSFAWEFRQGMAARAKALGDTGESSPEHWEAPLGTPRRPRRARGARAGQRAAGGRPRARPQGLQRALPGVDGDLAAGLPRAAHRDRALRLQGRHQPSRPSRAAASPGTNPQETPLKAGEFVLGYPDETRRHPDCRSPTSWAATAPTWPSASSTSAWRRSAGT